MTTEPGDNVTMSSGLLRGKLQHDPKFRRRLQNELLHQPHAQFLAREIFGMAKRQTEEDLLPWVFESRCVTNLDTFPRERERLRIISVRAGTAPMDRSRELVEYDDERQTGSRAASPCVQLAALSPLKECRELVDDLGIRASSKPPFDLTQKVRRLSQRTLLRKPEPEDILGRMHHRDSLLFKMAQFDSNWRRPSVIAAASSSTM